MDTLPPSASTHVDLRAHAEHASKMRESADIAQIAPALVRAQAAMENPPRNRSVQVRTQAGAYTFRYATLDKITEMTRRALAENGLCVLQPVVSTERGPALVTRLLHESGQWMECEILMPPLGSNPQAFGSAITYLRRYSVSAMLNIAADEDDDAIAKRSDSEGDAGRAGGRRAAGNHVQDVPPRKDRSSASSGDRASGPAEDRSTASPTDRTSTLAGDKGTGAGAERGGRGTRDGAGEVAPTTGDSKAEDPVRALIDRARVAESVEDGHALLEAWHWEAKTLDGLRGGKAWETLDRELGGALKRTLGTDPAAAFVTALRAVTEPQVTALQANWEGKWAETLSAMQQEAPATYALLRRHVAAGIARVRGTGEEAAAFEAHLRDEAGEVASDPITDPVAFARAYADAWQATDPGARQALAQAAKSAAARAVLDAMPAPVGKASLATRPDRPKAAAEARAGEAGR